MADTEWSNELHAVSEGDPDALQRLILCCHVPRRAAVAATLAHDLRHRLDPDDVLQEAYAKAFRALGQPTATGTDPPPVKFDNLGHFYKWLEGIALKAETPCSRARRHAVPDEQPQPSPRQVVPPFLQNQRHEHQTRHRIGPGPQPRSRRVDSVAMYAARRKSNPAMIRPLVCSTRARRAGSAAARPRRSASKRQTITAALTVSMNESIPNPTSAIEPATRPVQSATTPSATFQARESHTASAPTRAQRACSCRSRQR